ncbi:TetR/AcrR family transcriptional regulator [Mycobacterium sp.]|uniref:TetR/AcrR family transcriptional regulator n=1 Tax=Mycobacterium sp. TaxID=1785 RepID=UPI002C35789E|nr:TetR/AcrR family transcriptional regulator [Mycobacterium sp.]HTQ18429.1 TetR/AcrR family transcriptional regulator [Mycobacterium sp.]
MSTDTAPRPPGRPPGPTAKGTSTRRHIVEAAATVFADVGYDKARMSELVAATGMTKGAVYFHFDSKESLGVAVLEAKHQAWISDVERRLADTPPGRARLEALLPAMLALHSDDPSTWAISKLNRNLTELPSTHASAATLMQRWIDLIGGLIRDAQLLGECPDDIDPATAATVLIGAFDGLKAIHDTVSATGDSFTAAAELLKSMVLAYLCPRVL